MRKNKKNVSRYLPGRRRSVLPLLVFALCMAFLQTAFINNAVASSFSESSVQKKKTVTGFVRDAKGVTMPGVSIVEKGTTNGSVTNIDGYFSIEVTGEAAVLQYSFVGFKTLEQKAEFGKELSIVMKEDVTGLEEVVVVGYGTQKKVNLTGAVSQVTAEALKNKPVTNIGQALQGMIGNLNVTQGNGALNEDPKFNIRGGTSYAYNSNNKKWEMQTGSPLILVDGVEMDINMLNPEDIESISVLKDAASSAIYGARAAYGVMLVTTKGGRKEMAPVLSYNNSFQFSKPTNEPDLMDSYSLQKALIESSQLRGDEPSSETLKFLDKLKEYQDNPGSTSPYYMNGDKVVWNANTNPYDEIIRDDYAPMQKHSLSLRGGSERSSYYASVGYQEQEGIYKYSTDREKRYNILMDLSSDITDWLNLRLKASYNREDFKEPISPSQKGGFWYAASQEWGRNIFMPVFTPEDSPGKGELTGNIASYLHRGTSNDRVKDNTLFSIASTVKVLPGLSLKGDVSYKSYNYYLKKVDPASLTYENDWDNPLKPTINGTVEKKKQHSDKLVINAFADYTKTFGDKHNLNALIGFNQESYKFDELSVEGENMITDQIPTIHTTSGEDYADDRESHWAIRGAFFRLNYNYAGKYLFEMNGRYDGTSKFPSNDRFKFFPSFSVGWRVSEEAFMSSTNGFLNNLKLRASYGSLGNQNVRNYIYIPSYGIQTESYYILGGERPLGVNPPGLVSPSLTWETATTIDFGVDVMLFDKLDLSFDWYKRNTTDILTNADKLPAVLGAGVPYQNSGEMETKGWEFSLKWKDRFENGLSYHVGLVLSDYQSEIVKFNGNPEKLLSTLYEGKKMGEIWGYVTDGIFQSEEEVNNGPDQSFISSGQWYPGDVRYKNLRGEENVIDNGLATVDDPGDKKIIGNSTPRYQFGISAGVAWKGFDLDVFFQGVGKRDSWISDRIFWGYISGGTPTWDVYNDSWTPERPDAYYPAHVSSGKNRQVQTKYLQNTAYIRLKTLSLGYTLPKRITQKVKINNARIFVSGYNLWEASGLTKKTIDPENLSNKYPFMRTYATGIQVTF